MQQRGLPCSAVQHGSCGTDVVVDTHQAVCVAAVLPGETNGQKSVCDSATRPTCHWSPWCRTTQTLAEEDADKQTGGGATRASQPSLSAIVKTRSLFDFVRTDSWLHGKRAASCEIGLWGGLAPRPCYHREDRVYQVRAAQSQPTLQFNIVRGRVASDVLAAVEMTWMQGTVEG
ncbi:hypothetical protein C0Q70_16728 [Pomacea canaliculata]|uniref:Uncharacterized protein n=1 Tax=Pomacea canaliculata TaxID=400727 RepID=A0A2T7NQM3_POMCA|nr:hypothetical protein C0Q70_16728 [Pomacea canaliculata]